MSTRDGRPHSIALPARLAACGWALLTAVGAAAAEEGLLARWQFTPQRLAEGSRFPPVAGSLPAAVVVGPVRFADEAPRALRLDGDAKAGQRLAVAADLAGLNLPTGAVSVEAWVLLNKTPKWGGFVSALQDNGDFERGWLLGNAGRRFCFALASKAVGRLTYLRAPRPLETGFWYHVVGTYDGRVLRLYVDGRLVAASDEPGGEILYPPHAPLTLGAYHDDNELFPLHGRLEQAAIYSRALSAAEVRSLFDARKGRFPSVEPPGPPAESDWPTWQHDSLRTGAGPDRLPVPLRLHWVHRPRHGPRPAWPPPARDDLWHGKRGLAPRVTFDRAFSPVLAGGAVFFGSSADDTLTCLDARTGRVRWRFFAEGPIRLAPTVADGKVLFGSDDGRVYCLAAADGAVLWTHRVAPDRRIVGNGRMISLYPVRTGVLVADGAAHFCAGLFPLQGVWQAAADLRTGRLVETRRIDAPVQGYLTFRNGQIVAATGRDPAGATLSKARRRGKTPAGAMPLPEYPYAMIEAGGVQVGGGDGKVAAFDLQTGRMVWSADVDGRAYALAAGRGRLLVGTDGGAVYCFAAGEAPSPAAPPPPARADSPPAAAPDPAAGRIVEAAGLRRGWCLLVAPADAALAERLARRTEWRIVVAEPDAARADALRRRLHAAGLYGVRAAVHNVPPGRLPYADRLFNVVVTPAGALPRAEALRLLVPGRGTAVLGEADILRRPPLEGAGQWTHTWGDPGNTACSGDRLVGGAMRLQWFGRPGPREMIDRHHRNTPPLAKDGRLFVPGDDVVFALDAANGTILWKASLPGSRRLGVFLDCGSMALDERALYWVAGESCRALDVRTGAVRRTFTMPQAAPDGRRLWGYVARRGNLLVGSGRKPDAAYTKVSRDTDLILWHDKMKLVLSDYLFATDLSTGRPAWTWREGAILNTSIALGDGRAYFLASRAPGALADRLGRVLMSTFADGPVELVALDVATGKVAWRRRADLSNCRLIAYLCHARGTLLLSGCRYVDGRLWYFVDAFDAATGRPRWHRGHNSGFKPGGGHGEQNRHPVVVGDTVYMFPLAYRLETGEPVEGWRFSRRGHGCGNLSASANCLFWRGANPWMWDLRPGGGPAPLNRVSRPGCFINIIPAGGLVLIPEASSGCSCNFPIQTSMGFAPAAGP